MMLKCEVVVDVNGMPQVVVVLALVVMLAPAVVFVPVISRANTVFARSIVHAKMLV